MTQSAPSDTELVLTRVFKAPRELVWKAWTDDACLAEWWGPKGFGLEIVEFDFRTGGSFDYVMRTLDGFEMWGKFVYGEIKAPESMVFLSSFSDVEGGVTRAPFSQTWPLYVHNRLTLTETDGVTTLTLRGRPDDATDEERRTFEAGRGSIQQGFGGTFDQLDAFLAKAKADAG
jgi:uncharacterized protein YndB with AHSA1/START domain